MATVTALIVGTDASNVEHPILVSAARTPIVLDSFIAGSGTDTFNNNNVGYGSNLSNTDAVLPGSLNYQYNPQSDVWERSRGNLSQVLMASSSISASTAISVTNFNGRGIYAYMNITSAFPGSGSTTLALKVQSIPPNATASAITLAATAPRSTSGMVVICMYPGFTTGSNSGAAITTSGLPLPRDFRILASYSSAAASAALTVSIGMHIIL